MKRPLSYKTIADMIDISRLRSISNGAVFPRRGGASAPPLLYSAREGSEDLIDAANPRLGMMQAACHVPMVSLYSTSHLFSSIASNVLARQTDAIWAGSR